MTTIVGDPETLVDVCGRVFSPTTNSRVSGPTERTPRLTASQLRFVGLWAGGALAPPAHVCSTLTPKPTQPRPPRPRRAVVRTDRRRTGPLRGHH